MENFEEFLKKEKKIDDDLWTGFNLKLNTVEAIGTWYEMGRKIKFYNSTDFTEIKSTLYHDIYEKYRLDDRFRLVALPVFKTGSDGQTLTVKSYYIKSLEDFNSIVNLNFSEGKKVCYLHTIYPHFMDNKITNHTVRLTFA